MKRTLCVQDGVLQLFFLSLPGNAIVSDVEMNSFLGNYPGMPFPLWYFGAASVCGAPIIYSDQLLCALVFLNCKHRLVIFFKVKKSKTKTEQLIPVRKNEWFYHGTFLEKLECFFKISTSLFYLWHKS